MGNYDVHIIGKGSGWQAAPADGTTWGITQLIVRRPVSMVIDMNDYRLWGEAEAKEAALARRLAVQNNVPYVCLAPMAGCPVAAPYPLDEIINFFRTDYFNSTIDYALALAIHRGFSEIHLYGINCLHYADYARQKPSAEFWIGQAMGRGIRVTVHGPKSELLRTPDRKIYGYGIPQSAEKRI